MAGPPRIIDEAADSRMASARSLRGYAPYLLLYPLSGYCLPVLLAGTPIVWMLVQTLQAFARGEPYAMIAALLRISLVAIGSSWLLSYALRVIDTTARGHAMPPPMAGSTVHDHGLWLLRALPYPAAFVSLYYALLPADARLAAGVAALGALLWPAHALSLATEGSALSAISPLRLLRIIAGAGLLYALPCAALALAAWGLAHQASVAQGLLWSGIGLYCVFASCHLLGYVGFRRHAALGLDVEVGDPREKQQRREQALRLEMLCARIDECLLRGDLEAAARELRAEPGGPADVRQFHEDLFARLLTRGKLPLILLQGRRLITLLLDGGRHARALEVCEQCLNRDRHFEPETPRQLELLAREAAASRLDGLLERLLRDLAQRYPDDLIVLDGGLLLARYWCEQRNDDARALEILQPLLALTAHPRHAQAAALARALTRNAAPR